ncbi:AAA family ATPase [Erysipelothrix inopinata]|uniref:AAA family ATPase n=1 Tax=Erysipelothrix inopinata TaxID=225084 RepID=A0A7G9RW52_9FIRM|nr:ATP-binding protein [Erysipelothrix inopinata]QNN59827.1 AAA family ATPase [Erysipelothrix inopinata]
MWNAIDLHMHTSVGVTRDGKSDTVNFSYLKFVQVLSEYELKLLSVTNHNIIDFSNFLVLNYLSDILGSTMLLGVEFDTVFADKEDQPLHLVAISEKEFEDNFEMSNNINIETQNKKNNIGEVIYSAEELMSLVRNHNLVMIPHGSKSRGIFEDPSEENIKSALKIVREGFIRVFDSPSNWKLSQIKSFMTEENYADNIDDFGGVLFSDVRDWDQYSSKNRNFYMNAEPSFKGLIHSLSNPVHRFSTKDHINKNNHYISRIEIKKREEESTSPLELTENCINLDRGFNCIIGRSGSGKSLLLEIIKQSLTESTKSSYDVISDYEFSFYNESDEKLDKSNINIGFGEKIYDKIIQANMSSDNEEMYSIVRYIMPDFVSKRNFQAVNEVFEKNVNLYIDTKKKYSDNSKKIIEEINKLNGNELKLRDLEDISTFQISLPDPFKLTYTQEQLNNFAKYSEHFESLNTILNIYKDNKKINIKNKLDETNKLFKTVYQEITELHKFETYEIRKYDLVKKCINDVNGISSTNALSKSTLINSMSSTLDSIVSSFIEHKIDEFNLLSMDVSYNLQGSHQETLINKNNQILVVEKVKEEDIKLVSERENKLFKTYGHKTKLNEKKYDLTSNKDTKNLLNKYIKLDIMRDSFKINDLFDVEVEIFFDQNNIKNLNPGDIAKTYLEVYFDNNIINSNNSVILFDQLENDVDKDFISTTIKEQINKTKGKVQFIVVTHDPIIAVNADPTNYIEAIKNDKNIEYRNFRPESYVQNELITIANTVDGSRNVIKNRYEIYKGDRQHEN